MMRSLLQLLRTLVRDLRDPTVRFHYRFAAARDLPGQFGMEMRRRLLARELGVCGEGLRVSPGVYFWNLHKMQVGDNVGIGVGVCIQAGGGLTLGSNVSMGPGVKIWTQSHRYHRLADSDLASQGYDRNQVVIHDNVWLASNVFVLPGVVLQSGTVVTAGSVVGKKAYPPNVLLSGNPARVISKLDG
jgi:acetyltransferase-like isoleucine patch superfamily enzyme